MKAIPILVLSNLQLSYRIKIQFFFTFVFPLLVAFAYFQIFGRGNPDSVARMLSPLVSLTMMCNALLVAGMRSADMRDRDQFRQYHLTPVKAIYLILADLVLGYLTFLPVLLAELAGAHYIYHAPIKGSYLAILVMCSLGYLSLSALGLLLASIFNTAQEAAVVTQLLFVVLMFLSGTTMPLSDLPGFLQHLAIFTPPAFIIIAIQGVILRGYDFAGVFPEMAALLLSGITALIVTTLIFRWDKDEKVSRQNRIEAFLALAPLLVIGLLLNIGPRAGHWIPDIKDAVSTSTPHSH